MLNLEQLFQSSFFLFFFPYLSCLHETVCVFTCLLGTRSSDSFLEMADAVMQALSDVFEDMTLQIMNRKKEKAGAPAKLVAAVALVAQCTTKLEQIAVSLAKDEYEDFPVIANEINEAAKAVRDGSVAMAKATSFLQSGADTVSAWDDVGASVGQMVHKTMLLLDIV
jgi:hypothetical protein